MIEESPSPNGGERESECRSHVIAASVVVMLAVVVLVLRPGDLVVAMSEMTTSGSESARSLLGLATCYLALVGVHRLPRALTTNRGRGSARAVWSALAGPIVSVTRWSLRSLWGFATAFVVFALALRVSLPLLGRDEFGDLLSTSPEERAWGEVLSPSVTGLEGLMDGFSDWSTRQLVSAIGFFVDLAGIVRYDAVLAEFLRLEGLLFVLVAPTLFASGRGVSRWGRIMTMAATAAVLLLVAAVAASSTWVWADAVVFRFGFELVSFTLLPVLFLIGLVLALLIVAVIVAVIGIALAAFFGSGGSGSSATTFVRGPNSHINSDGSPKKEYSSEAEAQRGAEEHLEKFGELKNVYLCERDRDDERDRHWHIGG